MPTNAQSGTNTPRIGSVASNMSVPASTNGMTYRAVTMHERVADMPASSGHAARSTRGARRHVASRRGADGDEQDQKQKRREILRRKTARMSRAYASWSCGVAMRRERAASSARGRTTSDLCPARRP